MAIQDIGLYWKPAMHQVYLKEAETQLAELIEEAASGEEVIIPLSDGVSFKIVKVGAVEARPRFGSAKGLVKMSDDFDESLEGFEDYAS
jgi:antitoxin (DNA-binding transcriptional repressor) of toxin-antitoxin stability system